TKDANVVTALAAATSNPSPYYRQMVEKVARRFMATDLNSGPERITLLLKEWAAAGSPEPILKGIAAALDGTRMAAVPDPLRGPLADLRAAGPKDDLVLTILARMSDPAALNTLRGRFANPAVSEAARLKALDLLRQVRDPGVKPLAVAQLAEAKTDTLRNG